MLLSRLRKAHVAYTYAALGFALAALAGLAPLAFRDSTKSSKSSPPVSPLPSLVTPSQSTVALQGRGPFVVFGSGSAYALDLGTPGSKPIDLGIALGNYSWPSLHGSRDLVPILGDDGSISLVRREGVERIGIRGDGLVKSLAVSPDSKWLVAAAPYDGDYSARITLYSVEGLVPPRHLASMATAGDQGDMFQIFWTSPDAMTIIDVCHCDGGPGYSNTFHLSLTGRLDEETFVRETDPSQVGPQMEGTLFVYDSTPRIDCFEEPNPCANLRHTLYVADAQRRSLRGIASQRSEWFYSPQISPDGMTVTAWNEKVKGLVGYDVRSGDLVAQGRQGAGRFRPAGWVDEQTFIAVEHFEDGSEGGLWAVKVQRALGRLEFTPLWRGAEPIYLGVVR